MADCLLTRGDAKKTAGHTGIPNFEILGFEAKPLLDAARHFYANAVLLAEQRKQCHSPGVIRAVTHARRGYLHALQRAAEALDLTGTLLKPKSTREAREECLDAQRRLVDSGCVPTLRATLMSLDPSEQWALRSLYKRLSSAAQGQVKTWCRSDVAILKKEDSGLTTDKAKTLAEAEAQWMRVRTLAEMAAAHASLTNLLHANQPRLDEEVNLVRFL